MSRQARLMKGAYDDSTPGNSVQILHSGDLLSKICHIYSLVYTASLQISKLLVGSQDYVYYNRVTHCLVFTVEGATLGEE